MEYSGSVDGGKEGKQLSVRQMQVFRELAESKEEAKYAAMVQTADEGATVIEEDSDPHRVLASASGEEERAVGGACDSAAEATTSSADGDHAFLKPATPGKAGTVYISENPEDHLDVCRYWDWCGPQRKNLLAEVELREGMEEELMKKAMRKRRGKSKEQLKTEIRIKVQEKMASPPIQEYLKSQRETYESFKPIMLESCRCPGARLVG